MAPTRNLFRSYPPCFPGCGALFSPFSMDAVVSFHNTCFPLMGSLSTQKDFSLLLCPHVSGRFCRTSGFGIAFPSRRPFRPAVLRLLSLHRRSSPRRFHGVEGIRHVLPYLPRRRPRPSFPDCRCGQSRLFPPPSASVLLIETPLSGRLFFRVRTPRISRAARSFFLFLLPYS